MSKILVIPDLHEPCSRVGALEFCKDLRDKYKTDRTLFIGDLCDFHSISFHTHHPEMPGPKDEYDMAKVCIQKWYKAFPKAGVVLGNHDRRVLRLAESVNIPKQFLRDYKDIWGTPDWNWQDEFILEDVYYAHGDGAGSGLYPAYNMVRKMGMSCVLGHHHSCGGVKWLVNPLRRMFGLDTGSLIDDKSLAFAYGFKQTLRSVLSAAVVIDGIPHHIVLPCGAGEKYHDSKFTKGGYDGRRK